MLKPSPQSRTLLAILCCLSLLAGPVLAQETDTDTSSSEAIADINASEDEFQDEEPELPPEMLVLPADDASFQKDPEGMPIEEDWLRMPMGENPFYWRLELREQFGGTTNVDQLADANPSLTNRAALTGLMRYTFPTQTQVLLRSQAFLFNNLNVTERDQFLAIPLSLNVSQWFFDKLNIYAGYLPIYSTSINRQAEQIQRFDQDFMLGASYFYPLGEHYFFGGYQLDYMLASLPDFQYLGNLFFAGYRHSLAPDLFAFVDARLQPRGYMNSADLLDEIRFGGGAALQWHVFRPWLILEARGDYNQIVNFASAERSAGIFSFGINLITAIQSDS